jgi:hypothetical protein
LKVVKAACIALGGVRCGREGGRRGEVEVKTIEAGGGMALRFDRYHRAIGAVVVFFMFVWRYHINVWVRGSTEILSSRVTSDSWASALIGWTSIKNDCRRFEEILATLKDKGFKANYNILTSTLITISLQINPAESFRFVALIRFGNSSV